MQTDDRKKLPLDARLLSDAVIELNISRRSVGLYPRDHPIAVESIERAFSYLQKLFELRFSITLGIAGDTLVVDEYSLDNTNPVYREFAESLHAKGIAAVTFTSGLTREELITLHELVTLKEGPTGKGLAESLKAKDVIHISAEPIDFSYIRFAEGEQRTSVSSDSVWEDYIYGLLEGKLSSADDDVILTIPPEDIAGTVNLSMSENSSPETYDRVITSYLKKRRETKLSRIAFSKFFSFVERLDPELKKQFLLRSSDVLAEHPGDLENIIRDMTPESFEKLAKVFVENPSSTPPVLKNLIDKLSEINKDKPLKFDFFVDKTAVFDDIEIDENILTLFHEGRLSDYMSKGYKDELDRMLRHVSAKEKNSKFNDEFSDEILEVATMDIVLEIMNSELSDSADYMTLITKLSELVNGFLETGRFEEILEIYNVIREHALGGKFSNEASGTIEYFFHSSEFIARFVDTLRYLGRKEREGAVRLSKALQSFVVEPLLDALAEEHFSGTRGFLLSVLAGIGSSVVPHAAKRLNDSRWHVVRNMLYLLRECNGNREASLVRKMLRHKNRMVRLEALKTLLHFNTTDSAQALNTYLQSQDAKLRAGAIKLAGMYKVRDSVPYLIGLLEKKDIFGTESYYKMNVVRTLREIGDERAVGPLQNIINARTIFYRGNLEELKEEIFKSLDAYPPGSVRELAESGLASKNKNIKEMSEKLLLKLIISNKEQD